ncbi:uncharacterized protein FOMMEDRAFT_167694 [Fomitiporia mediterranea MF3/22]|uniref:uncharacterized protein n=1 Tax=Fomitiporia mediterranea (strain MF3/22) TaxID=694068 RepID=UPI0004407C04|nr:uncharacterized protein FOMMEDRAFT_167694 [Fomitiporia mediterranea MF3/22]EJD04527.1 hypothetical protein FOMMEDRAFT_167694 [Fomitiporia mediterranea MF3/22]
MSSTSSVSTGLRSPAASTSSDLMSEGDNDTSAVVHGVRFDERCVLIPQFNGKFGRARQPPRIGTFELPIPVVGLPWRSPSTPPRQKEFAPIQDVNGVAATATSPPNTPEAQRVVLKVPYPIFRRKSHSALQAAASCPPSCLRQSPSFNSPAGPSAASPNGTSPGPRGLKKRSNSLPPLLPDPKAETIPLRPCCERCLAACETHWKPKKILPTLEESSREHTPSQSRVDLNERGGTNDDDDENWCSGLHFTKGAMRLWRSASADDTGQRSRHSQEGSGLLGSLVRVDEVDRKRGTSPSPSPRNSLHASASAPAPAGSFPLKPHPLMLNVRDIERVKGIPSPSRSPSGSDEPDEDLFPLPSPKRSPGASPSDSATCLPVQVPPTEPRRLEAAIRAKIAERERKTKSTSSLSPTSPLSPSPLGSSVPSSPIPIPDAKKNRGKKGAVSHFRSNLDEIEAEYDPTLPDPDALPPTSTILLDSPPSSPPLGPSNSNLNRVPRFSASLPSLQLHKKEQQSQSTSPHANSKQSSMSTSSDTNTAHTSRTTSPRGRGLSKSESETGTSMSTTTTPTTPRLKNRRSSISNIMRASVSVLKGMSLTVQATDQTSKSSSPPPPVPPLPPTAQLSRGLLA